MAVSRYHRPLQSSVALVHLHKLFTTIVDYYFLIIDSKIIEESTFAHCSSSFIQQVENESRSHRSLNQKDEVPARRVVRFFPPVTPFSHAAFL